MASQYLWRRISFLHVGIKFKATLTLVDMFLVGTANPIALTWQNYQIISPANSWPEHLCDYILLLVVLGTVYLTCSSLQSTSLIAAVYHQQRTST